MVGGRGRRARPASRVARRSSRMPLLAAVVVVSLAAGIGVNTVVFSWMQARLFKPLPGVAGSSRLPLVEPRTDDGRLHRHLVARVSRSARAAAARSASCWPFGWCRSTSARPGRAERVYGLLVSGNYFPALGSAAGARPFFTPADVARSGRRAGRRHLARVLADALRRRRGRHRPAAPRQRPRRHDRRRRAARSFRGRCSAWTSTCGCRRRWRPILLNGLARARRPRLARLRGDGPAAAGVTRAARRRRELDDGHARAGAAPIPTTNRASAARCCRSGRRRAGRSVC